ncbi:MAG: secondary thiamine-phosphate synthase enzyme YjbQ [Dehalococcoidia bacterium]|nr:secondary thiamine-phosphate synthase enzyme YjbQ [Dehalococcoidia bacterium]MDW8120465.1 secondary thiamine-phosphate synthase enzyme YjbQ [Chloroflexota bacterium]
MTMQTHLGKPTLLASHQGTAWWCRTYVVSLHSSKAPEFIDCTPQVERLVQEAGVSNGIAVVFSRHTTAAVILNEMEPLLLADMERFLERLAPRNAYYQHNDFTIRTVNMNDDECPNGHAHCQHSLLGASETIPIVNGRLALGRWQRIFFVELDRPRPRELVVQIMGIA